MNSVVFESDVCKLSDYSDKYKYRLYNKKCLCGSSVTFFGLLPSVASMTRVRGSLVFTKSICIYGSLFVHHALLYLI